jgi:branched-chain amino acid transport system permease protein
MKKFKLKHWINYILILALAIPFTVMAFTGSVKGSTSLMLAQIGYSIILAVSLNLVVGFLGELSLGHAGFMCAGAYIGCFTANYLHTVIPNPTVVLILSMIVGGFTAAVFGLIIGLPTLRLKGDYLAIVTLAFGEIIRTVFMNQEAFGGALGLTTRKYGKTLFVIVFVMAIFTVFVTQNLMKSKHGRAIQAIRDNEIAARAMGVNVTYYKLAVFVIAAFFAGIAGVLYGHNTTPVDYGFFSFNYSVEILVMVVLGGMGNITGSILSATLLTFINIQLTTKLSGDLAALKYLIYALILIVAVIWNNAPALSKVRERFGLRRLVEYIIIKFRGHRLKEDGGMEAPSTADWSKVPTKIPMDALLSTDIIPEQSVKEEGDKK